MLNTLIDILGPTGFVIISSLLLGGGAFALLCLAGMKKDE